MGTKLYVGNLSYESDTEQLEDPFASYGTVRSAHGNQERDTDTTKRPRVV